MKSITKFFAVQRQQAMTKVSEYVEKKKIEIERIRASRHHLHSNDAFLYEKAREKTLSEVVTDLEAIINDGRK
jgi:cell fate (sporulation/competence/biofilm development) regulator YlbF (YheA/YmcA/DUF963 family)